MKILSVLFACFIGLTLSIDMKALSHYKELGCKFVYSKSNPEEVERCDCPFTKTDSPKNKCSYKGKEYEIGQSIDNNVNDHDCSVNCLCTETGEESGVGFTCAHVECPEFFNPPDPNSTCIKQYSAKSCCLTKEICDAEKINELATCQSDDKIYKEGEKFYPSDSCNVCICSKDFNGTLDGPWCSVINCGIEIHYARYARDMCAPVYFESRECCPIQWICPGKNDTVQESAAVKSNNPDLKCTYGDMILDIGDQVQGENECITCKCQIPPLVTCVQKAGC